MFGAAELNSTSFFGPHCVLSAQNILVSAFGTYKLCDFGSATSETLPENAALSSRLVADLEEDISRNTTLQYRAPEMIDLYQRMGLNEKVDIWALGVLLYKLCFFVGCLLRGRSLPLCLFTLFPLGHPFR